MWQEGSTYYSVPLEVTIRQIKQHRIKPEEINERMKTEFSTTTMSERSPSRRVPGSTGKIKVEEQTEEGVPQMDWNYSR